MEESASRIATSSLGIDTRPEQLKAFCDRHHIAHGFASFADALAWGEFDAVTNVTPDAAHYPTTLPILAAGKHILCEKPLALTTGDALAMVRACEKAGVVMATNHHLRNAATHRKMRELIMALMA